MKWIAWKELKWASLSRSTCARKDTSQGVFSFCITEGPLFASSNYIIKTDTFTFVFNLNSQLQHASKRSFYFFTVRRTARYRTNAYPCVPSRRTTYQIQMYFIRKATKLCNDYVRSVWKLYLNQKCIFKEAKKETKLFELFGKTRGLVQNQIHIHVFDLLRTYKPKLHTYYTNPFICLKIIFKTENEFWNNKRKQNYSTINSLNFWINLRQRVQPCWSTADQFWPASSGC